MLRYNRLLLLVSLFLLPLTVVAKETIHLNFDWPKKFKADVHFLQVQEGRDGDKATRRQERGGYTMVGTFDTGEYALEMQGLNLERKRTNPQRFEVDQLEAFVNRMTQELPRYRISDKGEFLGIENADALAQKIDLAIAELMVKYPEAIREEMANQLRQLLSPQQLGAVTHINWDKRVGFWVDKEMEPGESYSLEREVKVPALGDTPIPVRSRFRVTGQTTCERGGKSRRCVEIEMNNVPAGMNWRALEKRLVGTEGNLDGMEVELKFRLLTEIDTLLPHRVESHQYIRFRLPSDDNQLEQINSQTLEYQYH